MTSIADLPLSSTGSDQTASASPLQSWSEPWSVELRQLKQRSARFPTRQSFSAAQTKTGEWVLVGYVVGSIESQVADDFNDLSTYCGSTYTVASDEIFKAMITAS